MAWSRKSKAKGQRVVRRERADGSFAEYRYPAYKPHAKPAGDTLAGLVDAYKSSPEWLAFSPATQAGRSGYLKWFDGVGSVVVTTVRRRDIIATHDAVRVKRGPGAAGGFLAAARALFAWALQKEWIETSPVDKIRAVPGGHHRAWTRQEADAACAGLPERLRRVVVLARHTGQRRGDLIGMTWGAYDGSTIRITQGKSKPGAEPVRLIIPVTPALRAELDAWKADAKAVTILTNHRGLPWRGESLSHVLPIALANLGLSDELNVHGLRKLAATELANAGCSPHEIASITGHRTLAMVELYTRDVDQEQLAAGAVVKLADFRKKIA